MNKILNILMQCLKEIPEIFTLFSMVGSILLISLIYIVIPIMSAIFLIIGVLSNNEDLINISLYGLIPGIVSILIGILFFIIVCINGCRQHHHSFDGNSESESLLFFPRGVRGGSPIRST